MSHEQMNCPIFQVIFPLVSFYNYLRSMRFRFRTIALSSAFVVLSVAIAAYVLRAWMMVDSHPDKLWLHRTNSLEKLHEMAERYVGFEVDVCLRPDGTIDVTHDDYVSFGLALDAYFPVLGADVRHHMWIDVKNLDEENVSAFHARIDSLCSAHHVRRERLIIESPQWKLLRQLTEKGYYTSCYVTASRPSRLDEMQMDSVLQHLHAVAQSGAVRALSFPEYWYSSLKDELLDTPVDYLTWKHHSSQFGFMLLPQSRSMLEDERLKVILVRDKGRFHR